MCSRVVVYQVNKEVDYVSSGFKRHLANDRRRL